MSRSSYWIGPESLRPALFARGWGELRHGPFTDVTGMVVGVVLCPDGVERVVDLTRDIDIVDFCVSPPTRRPASEVAGPICEAVFAHISVEVFAPVDGWPVGWLWARDAQGAFRVHICNLIFDPHVWVANLWASEGTGCERYIHVRSNHGYFMLSRNGMWLAGKLSVQPRSPRVVT